MWVERELAAECDLTLERGQQISGTSTHQRRYHKLTKSLDSTVERGKGKVNNWLDVIQL